MNSKVTFNDCDFYNGYFYAASDKDKTFFRFNRESYEELFTFDDEDSSDCLFMQSVNVNDKIILAPSNADNIYVYDCNNEEHIQIHIHSSKKIRSKFHGLLAYDNHIYFIPVAFPQMVRMNIDDYKLDYIDVGHDVPIELNYAQEINGSLLSYKLYTKYLFEMNLQNHSSILKEKKVDCKNIWGYYSYGGYDFFVTDAGIKITKGNGIVFEDKSQILNKGIYLFTPYVYDDKVMFFPFSTGGHTSAVPIAIEKLSGDNFTIRELNGSISTCFHCIKQHDGKLYMLRNSDSSVIMFDPSQEMFEVYIKGVLKEVEQERNSFGLEEWLNIQLM